MSSFLVDTKLPLSNKLRLVIRNASIVDPKRILSSNPLERVVPFNFWFYHEAYTIRDSYENNQHIRLRYFDDTLITPVITYDDKYIDTDVYADLSLYQPFYPETFYNIWEFLQMRHLPELLEQPFKALHIGNEYMLGTLEAFILFHERYQSRYRDNTYHTIVTAAPFINYLGQAYKFQYITIEELIKYHVISIDVHNLFDNVFEWTTEEMDLQATLYYLLTSLEHLKRGGAVIVKLYMMGRVSWNYILDVAHRFFKENAFIRPTISNTFNSEIYLFMNKFKGGDMTFCDQVVRDLYVHGTYKSYYLNTTPSNPVVKKYEKEVNNWISALEYAIDNRVITFDKTSVSKLDNWFISNELQQIKCLTNEYQDVAIECPIVTINKKLEIKPTVSNILYDDVLYINLIDKKAELNFHKRVMDTKPSLIFSNLVKNINTKLLSWEDLTSQLNIFDELKSVIYTKYNGQMVTYAWMKMYEILTKFPDLIPTTKTVKTFHLCEAPGAFIAATNHYVATHHQEIDWYAQTLRHEGLSDHFGLINEYPDRWLFGDDDTGNICHSKTIKSYASLKDIDFMTSDAGIYCDPLELNEQESYMSKITMGQVTCILTCLSIGKSAIFKTYLPLAEPLTVSLMYLLTSVFNAVTIYKPITSHSCNSEVYIILRQYKGVKQEVLKKLYILLDDAKITHDSLLFGDIDHKFLKSYVKSIGKLIDNQIASLCRNFYYYYHWNEVAKFEESKTAYIDDWLATTNIATLDSYNLLKTCKS